MKKIGKRIERERKKLDITLKVLSEELGFPNYQTLSSIEKGKRQIKVSELNKIAKVLGVTVGYLLGEEELSENKVLWRKCTDETECSKLENKLKKFCNNFEKLSQLIDHKYEKFVPPSPKELQKEIYENDFEFAKNIAENYLLGLNLGKYPGNNLIFALQEKNILIFCEDLGSFGSSASLVGDFGAAILLNKKDIPWRRTFDIAHELFHLITWNVYPPEEVYDDVERGKSNPEKYADAFAASLLLPEKSLLDEIEKREGEKDLDLIDIIDIASKFKVSIQALTWRLQNLLKFSNIWSRLKARVFENLDIEEIRNHPKIEKLNKLLRSRQPDIPRLPVIYVTQALKTFTHGRISKLKLAEYLDVKYGDMASFLSDYSYPDIEEFNLASFSP